MALLLEVQKSASRLTTNCFSIQIEVGLVVGNSQVAFEKAENSSLNLIGKIYSFYKILNEVGSIAVTMCDSALGDFQVGKTNRGPALEKDFHKTSKYFPFVRCTDEKV